MSDDEALKIRGGWHSTYTFVVPVPKSSQGLIEATIAVVSMVYLSCSWIFLHFKEESAAENGRQERCISAKY